MISSAYRCDNWNQRRSEKKACSSLCFTILGYIKAQLPRNQSNSISPPLWRGNIPWKYLSYATMGRMLKDQYQRRPMGLWSSQDCSCKRKVLWFIWKGWFKTLEKTCGNTDTVRTDPFAALLTQQSPLSCLGMSSSLHPSTLLQHLSSFSNIFNLSAYNYILMKLMGLRAGFDAQGCIWLLSFYKLPCTHNYENKNWKKPCCSGNSAVLHTSPC